MLPETELSVADRPKIETPAVAFPEITLPAPLIEPPIMFPETSLMNTPTSFETARRPAASVRLDWKCSSGLPA